LRATKPFVMKMIQNSVKSHDLLTWCHLHLQFFVHQTVDTSAHTNYLILLVKERSASAEAKTDNYVCVSRCCQQLYLNLCADNFRPVDRGAYSTASFGPVKS